MPSIYTVCTKFLIILCCRYCPKHDACKSMQWQEQAQWPVPNSSWETSCDGVYEGSSCQKGPPDPFYPWLFSSSLTWPNIIVYLFQVSGVGKVTEKMLAALGIVSCAQLGQQMALVSLLFSETSWHHFLHISLGLGSTYVERCAVLMCMLQHQTYLSNINKLHGRHVGYGIRLLF